MNCIKYIDFHTHILPGIDDGAKTISESLEMLKIAKQNGAEKVILTPHYKSEISISEFCELRDKKFALLKDAMRKDGGDFPTVHIGAEVYINTSLSELPDLGKLCISNTNLLLIELPYATWNKWHYDEIYNIANNHNVVPVMAHIERYLPTPKSVDKLIPFASLGAEFQINADSFLSFFGKRIVRELAARGFISAIGSDCHDLANRSPDISKSINVLAKKFGDPFIDYIYQKSLNLLNKK